MGVLSKDAIERVKFYTANMSSPMGAYTGNSKGFQFARNLVADFIEKRDGVKCDSNNIYLTSGASEGVRIVLNMLIRNENDAILVPVPQYPLYSALITNFGGTRLDYFLDEEKNWALNIEELKESIAAVRFEVVYVLGQESR